jgi:hypothetical protein
MPDAGRSGPPNNQGANVPISSKLTVAWAVISLVISVSLGLILNYAVEARWVAPMFMGLVMGLLLVYGRIPPRSRPAGDGVRR